MNTQSRNGQDWPGATTPTRGTLFLRTFLPWQICRFIWINLKMMRIIARSHRGMHGQGMTGRAGAGPDRAQAAHN